MKNKIILCLVIGFAIVLHAATLNLSINLTAKEAQELQMATALVNKERAIQIAPLPPLSQAQFAEKLFRDGLFAWAEKAKEAARVIRATKYDALSTADQATVDAALK